MVDYSSESDEPDLAVFVVQLVHDGDFRRVSGLGSLCLIILFRSDATFFLSAFCFNNQFV